MAALERRCSALIVMGNVIVSNFYVTWGVVIFVSRREQPLVVQPGCFVAACFRCDYVRLCFAHAYVDKYHASLSLVQCISSSDGPDLRSSPGLSLGIAARASNIELDVP